MTLSPRRSRLHYVIAAVWLVLTVSLASWWLTVGLTLSNRMRDLGANVMLPADFRRMFIWEGAAFIGLLMAGGTAIVLAIRRENERRQTLETFFMSFTHDLKTALASIQLQAEGLREDWEASGTDAPVDRLLQDMVRLQIQLENSLFVAQPDGRLLQERIDPAAAITRLAQDWPDLALRVTGRAELLADARGFDAVLRNLIQNAVVHGGARGVDISVSPCDSGRVRLRLVDDGRGVPPEAVARLGQLFVRPGPTSGTGVGLFVCNQLVARMHGVLRFIPTAGTARGLTVELELPGTR